MAVETLTEFPASIFAGDTLRVAFSDSRFPVASWTARVLFQSAVYSKSFPASVEDDHFLLEISAADTATLPPDLYIVSLVYTETSTEERQTDEEQLAITVFADPTGTVQKSIARQTLEAMESALLKIAGNPRLTANFNGQTFTYRNLKDLQDAIDRQKSVVSSEATQLTGHRKLARIVHPL